jgi:MinD superfamily P-loop ATPase
MIVTVASGLAGIGKTSIAVNLALSIGNCQILDCNVEKPNSNSLLNAKISRAKFVYASTVKIDKTLCSNCGECVKFCKKKALSFMGVVFVLPELCQGCGACVKVCPKNAISQEEQLIGTLSFYQTGNIKLVNGELESGSPMAVQVIKAIKSNTEKNRNVIIDSPSANWFFEESVRNSDYCFLVSEPSPTSLKDLKKSSETIKKLKIPFGVIVNRAGKEDKTIQDYCKQENIPVILEIPYDQKIAELHSKGVAFSIEMPQWKTNFQNMFNQIKTLTEKQNS